MPSEPRHSVDATLPRRDALRDAIRDAAPPAGCDALWDVTRAHSVDGVLFHACSLDGLWLIHDNYPSSIPLFYIMWDTLRNLT